MYVSTDYQGLGTPGTQPFVVTRAEGRDVLDSIRAAAELAGYRRPPSSVVLGQSRGASAALAAAELQPTYAPELALRGVVAVAPASGLTTLDAALDGGPFIAYTLMVVVGYQSAYPDLSDERRLLTAAGKAALRKIKSRCGDQIVIDYANRRMREFGVDRVLHSHDFRTRLRENNPGHVRTQVPILIVHGTADETIPVRFSRQLLRSYCGIGNTVVAEFVPGGDHLGAFSSAQNEIETYIIDRLNGKPASASCGSG